MVNACVMAGLPPAPNFYRMHGELKRVDVFAQEFSKDAVDWGKATSSFGKVIGLSGDQGGGEFDVFAGPLEQQLMPLESALC